MFIGFFDDNNFFPVVCVRTEDAQVVDVEVGVAVGVGDVGGVELVEPVVGDDGAAEVVVEALEAVAHVAVFGDSPVEFVEVLVDHVGAAEEGGEVAEFGVLLAVADVGFGGFGGAVVDEDGFDDVLGVFDGGCLVGVFLLEVGDDVVAEALGEGVVAAVGGFEGFEDGVGDFELVEWGGGAVAFFDGVKWG